MECTWKDCKKEAMRIQLDKNGKQWANLCEEHHNELEKAMDIFINDANFKKMLSAWVMAQGGAKVALDKFNRR